MPTIPFDLSQQLEVPEPILFNPWKHHAGALRYHIHRVAQEGPESLEALGQQLKRVGTRLMDLYTGQLSPQTIGTKALAQLQAMKKVDREAFAQWLEIHEGYHVLTFEEDQSCWVLRLAAEAERYVHVHPGRWTPCTVRARANVLKTAILVLAQAKMEHAEPLSLELVNRVRREHLDLAPIGHQLDQEEGLGEMISLLS